LNVYWLIELSIRFRFAMFRTFLNVFRYITFAPRAMVTARCSYSCSVLDHDHLRCARQGPADP